MVIMKGLDNNWYRYLVRFILLFSYIIPISLRVNLDMAKVWGFSDRFLSVFWKDQFYTKFSLYFNDTDFQLFYAWQIGRDKHIKDTVVRSSTIPEELGRISYLLSDKTGTLTKNEMHFKKVRWFDFLRNPKSM